MNEDYVKIPRAIYDEVIRASQEDNGRLKAMKIIRASNEPGKMSLATARKLADAIVYKGDQVLRHHEAAYIPAHLIEGVE